MSTFRKTSLELSVSAGSAPPKLCTRMYMWWWEVYALWNSVFKLAVLLHVALSYKVFEILCHSGNFFFFSFFFFAYAGMDKSTGSQILDSFDKESCFLCKCCTLHWMPELGVCFLLVQKKPLLNSKSPFIYTLLAFKMTMVPEIPGWDWTDIVLLYPCKESSY